MERCEDVHGENNCEAITSTYVGAKCPKNYERIGCCSCAKACPKNFVSQGAFCQKPKSYLVFPRKSKKECYMANARQCVSINSKDSKDLVWMP